jgi:hypothetical protein
MTFAAMPFAESTFAGVVGGLAPAAPIEPGPPPPVVEISPWTVEISGMVMAPLINSISIDSELGRQGGASFTLHNVTSIPSVGQSVRILWYADVLFAGMLDRVAIRSDGTGDHITYHCECVDYSYLLFRRKIRKTYSDVLWYSIANDLISHDAGGDGLTFGTLDDAAYGVHLETVDVKDGNAHDLLSETAAAIGGIFYVDQQKRLNLVTTAQMPPAPEVIDADIVEAATLSEDRETYRNQQTITITGTPSTQQEPAITTTYTRSNNQQIAARQLIEGGTGIYNDFESITHPTSNTTSALIQLGVTYALLRLGAQGAIRHVLSIQTRATGFKAGQLATVDLPGYGLSGEGAGEQWIIQKVRINEQDGKFSSTTLELTGSSLIRRAQELWLDIVKRGNILVIPQPPITAPSAITTVTIATVGSSGWVVPSGVTQIQMTCNAAGGGGGGGATYTDSTYHLSADGGTGGAGGRAVSILTVTPGETLTMVVGAGGAAGVTVSGSGSGGSQGTAGLRGGATQIQRGATVLVSATSGYGGGGAFCAPPLRLIQRPLTQMPGTNGSGGNGLGQINTLGGGSLGGRRGTGTPFTQPAAGSPGTILLEY